MMMKAPFSESYTFDPSILRAYDIRGIIGETLSAEDAYHLGRSFATHIQDVESACRICVCMDGRESSPELEEALVKGLVKSGAEVIRVGLGPTPMLYHAVHLMQANGGIMVTGSHNPPEHNGFKCMYSQLPLFGETIQLLGEIVQKGEYHQGSGSVSFEPIAEIYVEYLASSVEIKPELTVAWDAGNGAAGEITEILTQQLAGKHLVVNCEIDGSFPNHHPDPSQEENMQQLIRLVKEKKCDVGFAFDGDGDRVGVVDNLGNIIWGDQLMMLLSHMVLQEYPGSSVIADVKASNQLFDFIKGQGGNPVMCKTGHSFIKTKMHDIDASLAGEMSLHIFFKKNHGFDDGLFAALQILAFVSKLEMPLSEYIQTLPKPLFSVEKRMEVDESRKFAIVEEISARVLQLPDVSVNTTDGVRVSLDEGWWLLRASNTQAVLAVRCESETEEGLQQVRNQLLEQLSLSGVDASVD